MITSKPVTGSRPAWTVTAALLLLGACAAEDSGSTATSNEEAAAEVHDENHALVIATVKLDEAGHTVSFLESPDEPGSVILAERGSSQGLPHLADGELQQRCNMFSYYISDFKWTKGCIQKVWPGSQRRLRQRVELPLTRTHA